MSKRGHRGSITRQHATVRPKKGAGPGYQLIVNDTTDNSLVHEQLARERAERARERKAEEQRT